MFNIQIGTFDCKTRESKKQLWVWHFVTVGDWAIVTWGQDYKHFSSMSRCSTHNLCSEMT